MPTRLRSSSSLEELCETAADGLPSAARSLIDAANVAWPDRLVAEPDGVGDPVHLYTETHYALAAVLLYLGGDADRGLLDLAAHRLRMWNAANGPMFAFNAMAVCLTALVLQRSGERHAELEAVLSELVRRCPEYRDEVRAMPCGNNAYLQQVAVDMILLPLARGQAVTGTGVRYVLDEFHKYRTPEGFFHDLPRSGTAQEPLCPPTYIMKMLFLAGVCHELHPDPGFAGLFDAGMASALPLLTSDGHFSYFGRTDNSPFAVGLTIFNLRKAARMSTELGPHFERAAANAERFWVTFPRMPSGMFRANRFGNAESFHEYTRSRDAYAYVGQYSLASAAYALLGRLWFPGSVSANLNAPPPGIPPVASSTDLGVVTLRVDESELVLRTRSELTGWDRRYLGPTILRYESHGRLLVGAISRTLSTDAVLRQRPSGRVARAIGHFVDRYIRGVEQLDATSVGFLPVISHGAADYMPYRVSHHEATPGHTRTRYQFVRLYARGWRPCAIEALEILRRTVRRVSSYSRPPMVDVKSFTLERNAYLTERGCRVEDRLEGALAGKAVRFSVRYLPGASVRVRGLNKLASATGWGSDGRQTVDLYGTAGAGSELRYECDVATSEHVER